MGNSVATAPANDILIQMITIEELCVNFDKRIKYLICWISIASTLNSCTKYIQALDRVTDGQLHAVSKFIHRYRLEIFVHGNGDKATFVLLGDTGTELIGRQVSELMNNYVKVNEANGESSNPAMSCDEENKANR
ncbi:Uncharacterized protein Rs2_06528 [Raphanus sativus]|nr:Uncharacterized protein Rs2_06528 [Raphanus sativus]